MNIILASTSPRRHELLKVAGVCFEVMTADIDESWQAGETADNYIRRMVVQKSDKVANAVRDGLILTADTIGVLPDGAVLTKPKDKADAFAMWERLSDSTHEIWTAVCATLVKDGQICHRQLIKECTQVDFVALSDEQKQRYWASGEPVDKAGAYAIQGGAMAWVRAIRGSYTNVVGLPLSQTLELIDKIRQNIPKA